MDKATDISHELKLDLTQDGRETFIPFRHEDLFSRLIQNFAADAAEASSFRTLFTRMQSIFHAEHLSALVSIEDLYCPLDPDNEQIQLKEFSAEEKNKRSERLFDRIANLAYAAHYQRLSRDELDRMISISSRSGIRLEVDFDIFDRLEIFARGYQMVDITRRRWQNFFREEKVTLPEFHRLIMAFRLKPGEETDKKKVDKSMTEDVIYIKNFKNIPETDLEILLPGTKVKLSTLDRGKIILPTIAGMAPTIYKFVRNFLLFTGAVTVLSFWGNVIFIIVAMLGYIGKSVFAYFRTKNKHEFNLTKNLYLKNLDNNAGVLYRLLIEAQEQELCETTLGYAVLHQHAGDEGLDELEIDRLAEEFLMQQSKLDIDFDLHDALGKLARLGLVTVCANGRWKAVPLDNSASTLSKNWNRLFSRRTAQIDSVDNLDDNLITGTN